MNQLIFNIISNENINFNRLGYVVDFIDNHPLKPSNCSFLLNSSRENLQIIDYSNSENSIFKIPVQNELFRIDKKFNKHLIINKYMFENSILYSVENQKKECLEFCIKGHFSFDIFETIFFHISRIEEYFADSEQLDMYGKMKIGEQLLVKQAIYEIPVVDILLKGFFKALGLTVVSIPTTYSLTHDLDILYKYDSWFKLPKSIARVILMGLGMKGIKSTIHHFYKSRLDTNNDPYHVYDWLFSSSESFHEKVIYFMAGGKTKYDLFNNNYKKNIAKIISLAIAKGYKIGLHPSYNAHDNNALFVIEKELLQSKYGAEINRVRTHFLRFRFPETLEVIENNQISHDSSFGYNEFPGFKCGTGFPYLLYNVTKDIPTSVIETPLILMDSSLIFFKCKEDQDCYRSELFSFIEKNKLDTHITFNFHNSSFDKSLESRYKLKEVYNDLLEIIGK